MKITTQREDQTITYPSLRSFYEGYLVWEIEGTWIKLREWAARQVCRFKGHVKAYDEFDVDGEYPFCRRCRENLPAPKHRISPYLR